MRDVIEQYSQGHLNMMMRIKVWRWELCRMTGSFVGAAEKTGPDTRQAGHLQPVCGQERSGQASDYRDQAIQDGKQSGRLS